MNEYQSRVEQILSGTFTGVPQSRVEALLVAMVSGGSITPVTPGGSATLTSAITVTQTVGGITAGKTYPAGTSIETIIRDLTTPAKVPTLTAPSMTINASIPTLVKTGTIISNLSVTSSFDRGKIDPKYTSASGYRSGEASNYSLTVTGADDNFSESNANGRFVVPKITRSTNGKVYINGTVSYAAGVQPKDSKGNNYDSPLAAGTVSKSKEVEFLTPFYRGVVTDVNNIYLDALTEELTRKETKTYSYATTGQHMVFAYDQSYGNLSSIKDENGFETIDGWTKKVIGNCFVYVFNNATFDPDAGYTFKF